MLAKVFTNKNSDKSALYNLSKRLCENYNIFEKKYHNFYKYFLVGGLVVGGVMINNYEEIFNFLNMKNSFMKRRLDIFFRKQIYDENVSIKIPDEVSKKFNFFV
jgi:hypothetical protein